MPIINSISNIKKEMQEWRRYLHENPELGFEEYIHQIYCEKIK